MTLPKWIEDQETKGLQIREYNRVKQALEIAWEALEQTLDYGKALQPTPMHPVTFNACVIAQDAMRRIEEMGEGK